MNIFKVEKLLRKENPRSLPLHLPGKKPRHTLILYMCVSHRNEHVHACFNLLISFIYFIIYLFFFLVLELLLVISLFD